MRLRPKLWTPRLLREERGGLWVPPPGFTQHGTNLTTPVSGQLGTLVTASGTAHTKGSYSELVASLGFDVFEIDFVFSNVGAPTVVTSMLVDIAVGAAGSETNIIPNLIAGGAEVVSADVIGGQRYRFPLYIASGSRLSARCQAAVVSDTVRVAVWYRGAPRNPGVWAGSRVSAYGIDTGTSLGTSVAAGLSAAEGTFTQITASTSEAHDHLVAGVGLNGDSTTQGSLNFLDLGVGAATEDVVVENMPFVSTGQEAMLMGSFVSCWVPVASGTRIAARISSNQSTAQSYDVGVWGVS